jgi:GNAT superfamily N-acetyltransferase
METRDAFRMMQRSMRRTAELLAGGAPDSRALQLDGITAAITPAAPDRSVLNGVVVEDFAKLPDQLGTLAAAYEAAGVRAWTVWVPEGETAARELLAGAGHVLDATPAAMLLDLDELREPVAGTARDYDTAWDIEAAGAINDAAYGDTSGLFARAMGGLPADTGHMYLARVEGRPASFVLVHDHDGDCEFWIAATIPEARGRGILSGLLHRALLDARERGCTISTTQATKMGEPVYDRLGYRKFGTIEMWERRAPVSGAA